MLSYENNEEMNFKKIPSTIVFFIGICTILSSCNQSIKEYWNNGNVKFSINYFSRDKANFIYREYYENGCLMTSATYKNGMRNGEYRKFFKNGQVKVLRHFKNGELEGLEQIFDESGKVLSQSFYKYSKIITSNRIYRREYQVFLF